MRAMTCCACASGICPLAALRPIMSAQNFCASATASRRASARSTVMPPSAATCAMPRPMTPVPTMPAISPGLFASKPMSAAPELRRALLDEGRHALLLVGGVEHQLESLTLEQERGLERQIGAVQDHLLDLAGRDRRQGRDALRERERERAVEHLGVGHDLGDEAERLRLTRRHWLAG